VALAALLAALAALAAACGSDAPKPGPQAQVQAYFEAVRTRDAGRLCDLLTDQGLLELVRLEEHRGRPCEQVAADLLRSAIPVRQVRVKNVQITGDRATVSLSGKAPPYDGSAILVRTGDGWRFDFPPAILTRLPNG
jgi:hypothetical protein